MSLRRGIYAGSFDPPTNGHMYMIREGAKLFDELIVAVGVNPDKKTTFGVETRLRLLRAICQGLDNVRVDSFENQYLIRWAASQGATHVLRGLRNSDDFSYEYTMRQVNEDLEPGITTVFLVTPRQLAERSSSFVKGLVGPQGWRDVVKDFVPPPVYTELLGHYGSEE